MNRRGFLGAIVAAAVAGPKAIGALLERHRQRDALVFSIDYPYQFTWRSRTTLQKSYRKIQSAMLEGFQYEPEEWINVRAQSGFRAWSQRHPS